MSHVTSHNLWPVNSTHASSSRICNLRERTVKYEWNKLNWIILIKKNFNDFFRGEEKVSLEPPMIYEEKISQWQLLKSLLSDWKAYFLHRSALRHWTPSQFPPNFRWISMPFDTPSTLRIGNCKGRGGGVEWIKKND